jgi:hypothetical protein
VLTKKKNKKLLEKKNVSRDKRLPENSAKKITARGKPPQNKTTATAHHPTARSALSLPMVSSNTNTTTADNAGPSVTVEEIKLKKGSGGVKKQNKTAGLSPAEAITVNRILKSQEKNGKPSATDAAKVVRTIFVHWPEVNGEGTESYDDFFEMDLPCTLKELFVKACGHQGRCPRHITHGDVATMEIMLSDEYDSDDDDCDGWRDEAEELQTVCELGAHGSGITAKDERTFKRKTLPAILKSSNNRDVQLRMNLYDVDEDEEKESDDEE